MPSNFEQSQKNEFDQFFLTADVPDNRALRIELEMLLGFMGDLAEKRVLDLGCGVGRNGIQIARYAAEVVGYDLSEVAVARANETAQQHGVTNFRAEVNNFSDVGEERFDVVLCVNMLHHANSPQAILNSISNVLRPGGRLIILENNPLNPLFPLFFILIGQFRAHLTRQYFMVNRFTLRKLIGKAGMAVKAVQRHGFLPTMLYNYSLAFKSINEFLNRIPVFNEFTAFYLIEAVKPDSK